MISKFMKSLKSEEIKNPEQLWALYMKWCERPVKHTYPIDDRIKQFVADVCDVTASQQIGKEQLHEMYMAYSADFRGASIFARELRQLLGKQIRDYRPATGNRLRCWKGIGLKV